MFFDGLDDGYGLPDVAGVGDYTIACKFRRTSATAGVTLTGFDNFNVTPRNAAFYTCGFASYAAVGDTGGEIFLNDPAVDAEASLVIRRIGTLVEFFINGLANGDFSKATVGAGTFTMKNIRIGCHGTDIAGVPTNTEFFPGRIGPWGLWKRGWTSQEIQDFSDGSVALGAISTAGSYYYLPLKVNKNIRFQVFGNPVPA